VRRTIGSDDQVERPGGGLEFHHGNNLQIYRGAEMARERERERREKIQKKEKPIQQ